MYKTGEIAKMSGVSIRTIRYYDSKGLLRPSAYSKSGHRLYTDEDFSKLKRILALKYLGLSLEEVMGIESKGFEKSHVIKTLALQKQILKNKVYHMKIALDSIEEAEKSLVETSNLDWSEVVDVIKIMESEKILRQRCIDLSNLSTEIKFIDQLNSDKNWYQWVFERLEFKNGENILEIGCGEGALWYKNESALPASLDVTLTEVTNDLLNSAKRNLLDKFDHFKFGVTDLDKLTFLDESFDVVIANHVLFFSKNVEAILSEIKRVLKIGGRFYCSTISECHMQELEELINNYNQSIKLGKTEQLENFGYKKAKLLLEKQFTSVKDDHYEDELVIHHANELLNYIYSMPGEMLVIANHKKKEFETYVHEQVEVDQQAFKISNCHILFRSIKRR